MKIKFVLVSLEVLLLMSSLDISGVEASLNDVFVLTSISTDGRYVAFWSNDTNLAGANRVGQIVIRDRKTNTTTLFSVDPGGNQGTTVGLGLAPAALIKTENQVLSIKDHGQPLVTR